MNKQRLSGIVLITGFIVLLTGVFFTVPNLYQETDIDVRMELVENNWSKFTYSQIITVVSVVLIAAGYLLLTSHLRRDKVAGLANIGTAAMLLGTISLVILMLQGLSDPRAYLERNTMDGSALSIYDHGFTWLTIAGYLIYGMVFLRGIFSKWLAHFTLGFTTIILVIALIFEKAAVELLFLMPLVVGITLLRRSNER